MKRYFILCLALLSTMGASAQVWHGANFGMSQEQVSAALADFNLIPENDHVLVSLNDFLLDTPSMPRPVPFVVHATFSGSKLITIDLVMDFTKMPRAEDLAGQATTVELYGGIVRDMYIAKYGKPSGGDAHCPELGDWMQNPGEFCSTKWSTPGAAVSVFWMITPNKRSLTIEYTAVSDQI